MIRAPGLGSAFPETTLLRAFLETTRDVVFFKDLESRFLAASRSLYAGIGLESEAELLGKTDFDYFPPEFAAQAHAEEQEVIRTRRRLLTAEQELALPDGRVLWITASRMPLLDEAGNVIGTFAISRDTTDRRHAETALREQTDRLSRINEIQRDIAAAQPDLQSVMGVICERMLELTGAPGASIVMLDGDELVHRSASGCMADKVGERLPIDSTFTGRAYRRDSAELVEDTHAIPGLGDLASRHDIRSLVAVPLRHAGRAVGLLNVVSPEPNAFDESVLRTLEVVSVVLSSALSHAAEFESKRAQVEALTQFHAIFEEAPIGIVRTAASGRTVEANRALERMLGYEAGELDLLGFEEYTRPGLLGELMGGKRDSYQVEKRLYRKDGTPIWAQVTAALELDADGLPGHMIAMIEDISQRKAAEEELRRQSELNEQLALHDALTGLPNRTLFRNRIEHAIHATARDDERLAVLVMDLDRFKEINDSLGHDVGDALLQELGERVRTVVRPSDTVARLGGDEFGLLLPGQCSRANVGRVIERVRDAVERPVVLKGLPLAVEASIGVAFFPDHGQDVDTLIRHADLAMYNAKQGSSSYAFFEDSADAYDPTRLTLVGELRRAIEQRELALYYQPKAALATGDVRSVEALLRWNHPERGLVMPDDFIPLVQQTGLIKPMTLYVVEEALRQCGAWQRQGITLSVAVNLSARNLLDLTFPDDVDRLLSRSGIDAVLLELEITESTMLADPLRAKLVLERLSALGIRLSIDDFGTGYSSLSYLKGLPINEIKIDRSFVMTMCTDDDDETIVRSTIELARNLGLDVVAEGVETEEIWRRLVALGCTTAQGYYLSRPVPAPELQRWLVARARASRAA